MRVRPLLLLLVSAATVWSCTGGPGNNKVTPPDTAAPPDYSEQRYASQAMSGSAIMQTVLFGIHDVIALGTTTTSTAFVPRTMFQSTVGPTGTVTPPPPPSGGNDYSDPDGDGIPNDTLLGMTNQTLATAFGSGGLNGYVLTTDLTPNIPDGSFQGVVHLELTPVTNLPFGWSSASDTFDSTYQAFPALGAGLVYSVGSGFSESTQFTEGTAQRICASQASWTLHYAPAFSWTPGKKLVDGTLLVDGSGTVQIAGKSWPVNVATTTALQLSVNGCVPSLVTAGRVDFTFGTSGTLSAHWTGCGAMAVDTPPPPP